MNKTQYDIIAIDIAKETLQVQGQREGLRITNNKGGFAKLLSRTAHLDNPMVVCEASGGYERALMGFLFSKGIAAVALVNPRRVRVFAHSEGIKAKTDPIYARVLPRFAQEKKLTPMPAPDPKVQLLADHRQIHPQDDPLRSE